MGIAEGLTGRASLTVSEADTAIALGSGDVPVLGTPRVVALAERATVAALAAHLQPGTTSVGTRVAIDHLAATGPGREVAAEAVLTTVDGRRLGFEVTVTDGEATIATGRVDRVLVDRDRFLARVPA
jgi:fluoroacetyl-CoA thioesterase